MPKGTPGRKSFTALPFERKKFWRPEAKALRNMFPITAIFHILFLVSDIMVFGEILMIVSDSILIWLDFYNYMILNKVCVFVEVLIHVLIILISITHIQRGL